VCLPSGKIVEFEKLIKSGNRLCNFSAFRVLLFLFGAQNNQQNRFHISIAMIQPRVVAFGGWKIE
jgi:hypothetical protein